MDQSTAQNHGEPGSTTGDTVVDLALAPLADVTDIPVRDRVAVFEQVHAALQDRLADSEDG